MDIITLVILLVGGLFSGVLNAVVGGGTVITVPLLVITGLPMHLAIGTNRFAMIFNTGVGAIGYHRKVKFNLGLALFLAAVASIGSIVGVAIVLQTAEEILKYIIAILMLIMGSIIMYKKKLGLEEKKTNPTKSDYIMTSVLSFFLGIYGGFFGAGVSTMFTFMFVSFYGMSFIKSAGITRFVVSLLSMIAFVVFLINMKVNFVYGIILSISLIAGAKIGVDLAVKAGNIWIRRLFIFFVIISSIRLFVT